MKTPQKLLFTLLSALLLGFLPTASQAARPKNGPPAKLLRDFYVAMGNGDTEAAKKHVSTRYNVVSDTQGHIKKNGGLAKLKILKVSEEEIRKKKSGKPPEAGKMLEDATTHLVRVDHELSFKNGSVSKKQALLEFGENLWKSSEGFFSAFGIDDEPGRSYDTD